MTRRSGLIGKQRRGAGCESHRTPLMKSLKCSHGQPAGRQVPVCVRPMSANLTPAKTNLWAGRNHESGFEIETLAESDVGIISALLKLIRDGMQKAKS